MSRLTRRVAVKAKGAATKTYADFQAHIATLATNGNATWSGSMAAGARTITAATATGVLVGSSWNTYGQGAYSRAVQHGLPSQTVFASQVAEGRQLFVRIVGIANKAEFFSISRNGYTSVAQNDDGVSTYPAFQMTDLIRWDDTLKKAFRSNPSIGGAEVEYVF